MDAKSSPIERWAKAADALALWAVVPVKRLEIAKSRLSPALSEAQRSGLALAMAEDVLAALVQSEAFDGIVVVSADPRIWEIGRGARCTVISSRAEEGLDEAVRAGMGAAAERGAHIAAFIPADVPFLSAAGASALGRSLRAIFSAGNGIGLGALAPCSRENGTNLLAVSPAFLPTLAFGAGSFHIHSERMPAARILFDQELASDIDLPADLAMLRQRLRSSSGLSRRTSEWLTENPAGESEAMALLDETTDVLAHHARTLRDLRYPDRVTYSKKVFIPLTHLCRDSCAYCTFARSPRQIPAAYMSVDEAVAVAIDGARMGCKEALLTLGERPETRYRVARQWLDKHGFATTVEYVATVAAAIRDRTGLLPHINMGVLEPDEIAQLREVCPSMGAMIENLAPRLSERGGPHFAAPDKCPDRLVKMLDDTGAANVPFTTGLLVGIGETRAERISSLLAIRAAHERHGHIQEVIIQNFVPKPGTRMGNVPPPPRDEFLWTVSVARLLLPLEISLQVPPNLNEGALAEVIDAGINDWGGVSPLTPDYVNPEKPWPTLEWLNTATDAAGKRLVERLTIYPDFILARKRWVAPTMVGAILKLCDGRLLARPDDWLSGTTPNTPSGGAPSGTRTAVTELLDEVERQGAGHLGRKELALLFEAERTDYHRLCDLADQARAALVGDAVTYVINRNINYTNICIYKCAFCAFSKGSRKHAGGEAPYRLDLGVIQARVTEAWARGATEVCLQGGIHPSFDGATYLEICAAVRSAQPHMHIHAFSPLEISHGASTLGLSVPEFLNQLKQAGLGSLPGTAAEILHDPVRDVICPDKLTSAEWLDVIEAAHEAGLPTTATIMFGHIDGYSDWAIHLDKIRALQRRTGGLTEFVPLPFVAHEAPMFRKGYSRAGPTFREAVLMHAVSRLVFAPHIRNIQTSWVKMGREGALSCLRAGANDLGGVLMDESITRAAGASHGREMTSEDLIATARGAGRIPVRRTTTYRLLQEEGAFVAA